MKILKLSQEKFEEIIRETISVLCRGGVVAIPTDTIYGFAADALNPAAVQKVFEIKGRPEEKSLPIFVESIETAEKLAEINARQRKFLEKVWPGKLTAVLKAREGNTIALRIPNHDFVLKLLQEFGGPLTGTSANISGQAGHTKINELISEFEGAPQKPDLIIDAGDIPPSEPSTVVDLTKWPPAILRPGAVSEKELQKILDML
ncbi:MAG: L-threonylcarbamoyladenylate synthase [bacterium]|nr:L-threonylcarbamoyladenylate synthase [bacterium]